MFGCSLSVYRGILSGPCGSHVLNTSANMYLHRCQYHHCCIAGPRPLRWGCHGAGMKQTPAGGISRPLTFALS